MNRSPVAPPKLHFFSYKSAILFFSFVFISNLIFNPLLSFIGVEKQLALYLINSIAISVGLTAVIVLVEIKFTSSKQMTVLFLSLFVFCMGVGWLIIYR